MLLIDDLISLVHQQCRTLGLLAAQSRGLYDSTALQPTDELLYAMYIHELDGIYAQTDAVFESCGMESIMDPKEETTSFQHTTLTASGDTASMRCGWKQLFPFRLRRTCDAMWLLAHLLNRQDGRDAPDDIKDPERTIAAKFRVTNQLAGGKGRALVHRFAQGRYVDGDREVSVWKSSSVGGTECAEACRWRRRGGASSDLQPLERDVRTGLCSTGPAASSQCARTFSIVCNAV